nr:nucleotidyltransferase family protein [Terriglobus saanensis]
MLRRLKNGDVSKPLSREQKIHEAILLSFSSPVPDQVGQLLHLSSREWQRLLHWLDVSGLTLYLLERFKELGLRDTLPQPVLDRLQQNMDDNKKRTQGMLEESIALQREFQQAGLSYAVMKGVSLCPISVPRPELRHQFDLDYLIAERSVPEARRVLERRGYRLYAISGKSWEFKLNETPHVSTKDFYKDLPDRAVELHLETETSSQTSRLARIVPREICGLTMPVLSPIDLFLGQGLHAFKDVCSEFSRTAHLLEFYRHVLARYDDDRFWRDLRATAERDPRASLGIGVVIYLITNIMGDFAPEMLMDWTVGALPPSALLWVDLYGRRTVFGKHPGSKLYLLLQRELETAGVSGRRPIKKSLLPSKLPPIVIRSLSHETISTRIARYRVQTRFILSRLRFHAVEGFRYAVESYRWQRHLDRLPI